MTLKEAFQAIVDNQDVPALNWAVNYAKLGREMCKVSLETPLQKDEMRAQILYTKGNIQHWRGEIARQVRETFNNWLKEN